MTLLLFTLLTHPAQATCRTVSITANGHPVIGIEDMALDAARGQAVLSAYDRRTGTAGGLYLLTLDSLDAPTVAAVPLATGLRPAGIDLRAEPDGSRSLLAISRREDGSATVERYRLDGSALTHQGTIASPLLCRGNDVAFLDGDRFLFTSSHGGCGWGAVIRDNVLGGRHGFVGLVENDDARVLIGGIGFANGLFADPSHDRLTVAATREDALLVYRLSDPQAPPRRIAVPGGPDNLTMAPDGRLLVALHPSPFRLALHRYGWPGGAAAPTRIAALGPAGTEVLLDEDGERFPAATVALGWNGRLIAGSVTAPGLLVCDAAASGATGSSAPAGPPATR
ncbi:hypothetical protein TSH58p_24405 (plasmid) [Azospirillum sp. TSH58]|uniref:SMP-30/gluconolactonase/LRE family protein n=1 Tax=Azospirillum sp. TSH58 TaxID=664962 RepID=UPI000D60252D|nr:hypothetical protein [Azospirillum sp. TSH58]AWJ86618.1 hypothetical protein TSH58p_24405 [Azospirillum sp. TSH58]PWC61226.1 hypothetical protein TSH58_27555 [Azospirillum sp. TSH58]